MITIKAPHMGLNDERAPVFCQMWNTWKVKSDTPKEHVIKWTASVARSAPGGKLSEIVISCHGAPAYLQLGEGFGSGDARLFQDWKGLVDKIWLRACYTGRIVDQQTAQDGDGAFISALKMTGDGNQFCSTLARSAECYVVVSTELQISYKYSATNPLPYGKLDTYEGLVLSYNPQGVID